VGSVLNSKRYFKSPCTQQVWNQHGVYIILKKNPIRQILCQLNFVNIVLLWLNPHILICLFDFNSNMESYFSPGYVQGLMQSLKALKIYTDLHSAAQVSCTFIHLFTLLSTFFKSSSAWAEQGIFMPPPIWGEGAYTCTYRCNHYYAIVLMFIAQNCVTPNPKVFRNRTFSQIFAV